MKDILTTREEFLLAKLAGRDVDLDTLHPAHPMNMTALGIEKQDGEPIAYCISVAVGSTIIEYEGGADDPFSITLQ